MTPASPFALLCPVCGGQVEQVSELPGGSLFTCRECHCDVIVPADAWEVARFKREQKWQIKRSTFNPLRHLFGAGASVASGPGTRDR